MKTKIWRCFSAIALLVVLAIPVESAAQKSPKPAQHHRYRFVDVSTFGGPNVVLATEPTTQILSNAGAAVGGADTSTLNPNYPNINPYIGGDAYIGHAFLRQRDDLTDLGTLPGGFNSSAVSINEKGVVAGISEDGETDPFLGFPAGIAVLWKDGNIVNLGTLEGGYESIANAVNNLDQVTGPALNTVPDPYSFLGTTQTRGFFWANGVMADIGTLGGPDAFALYINCHGQVAGFSYTNSTPNPTTGIPTVDPFLWDSRTMTMLDLRTLGGVYGVTNALNEKGEVVGSSDLDGDQAYHPFLWHEGTLTDLGTLGGTYADANWINDAGDVVGWANLKGDQANHAFLWRKGVMTDLGRLKGLPCSNAHAINSSGQVVGWSDNCSAQNERAFLWEDGQMTDLNVFVPPNSGVVLGEADFINDHGEIIGYAFLQNGDKHAYLLVPCDQDQGEGCQGETANAGGGASASGTASFFRNPAAASPGSVTPIERMAALRARLGRRYLIPSLAQANSNQLQRRCSESRQEVPRMTNVALEEAS